MTCSPDKCPHRALLEKARAACLACDHTTPSGHGGMVSAEAAGKNVVRREMADIHRGPRGQVTDLPAEYEDRLADLLRRWVSLDTVDALLMIHVANGGTTANFGAYLARVRDQLSGLPIGRESYRATAWAKFKALVKRFGPFLKGRLRSWDDGHGGAVRKERESAEQEARQMEFTFESGKNG